MRRDEETNVFACLGTDADADADADAYAETDEDVDAEADADAENTRAGRHPLPALPSLSILR